MTDTRNSSQPLKVRGLLVNGATPGMLRFQLAPAHDLRTSFLNVVFTFRDPDDLPTMEGYANRTSFFYTIAEITYEIYIVKDLARSNERRSSINEDYYMAIESSGDPGVAIYPDSPDGILGDYGKNEGVDTPVGIHNSPQLLRFKVVAAGTPNAFENPEGSGIWYAYFWEPFVQNILIFSTYTADDRRFSASEDPSFTLDGTDAIGDDYNGRAIGLFSNTMLGHADELTERLTESVYAP